MAKPLVTIVDLNRNKTTVPNVAIATDTDHAKHILNLAIALSDVDIDNVRVAQYTLDGKMMFGLLRQSNGLNELTPAN